METTKVHKTRKLKVLSLLTSLREEAACSRSPVFQSDRYEFLNFRPEVEKCTRHGRLDVSELSERSIEFVQSNNIDIVFAVSDQLSPLQCILSEKFPEKFRGPSLESFFLTMHKFYTREIVDPNPMPFCHIELDCPLNEEELEARAAKVGFPAFFKPCLGSYGTLGRKVNSIKELNRAIEDARDHYHELLDDFTPFFAHHLDAKKFPLALKEGFVLEKYIDAPQKASLDGYVCDGQVTHWAITDWTNWPSKPDVPQLLVLPSILPDNIQAKLWDAYDVIAQKLIHFGFNNQFLNVEFFVCKDGDVRLLEVNGRVAAVQIPSFLEILSSGDAIESLLDILRGEKPQEFAFTGIHSAFVYLTTLVSGKLSDIIHVGEANSMEYLTLLVKPDNYIKVVSGTGSLFGYTYVLGDSREDILKKHKEIWERLFKKDPFQ